MKKLFTVASLLIIYSVFFSFEIIFEQHTIKATEINFQTVEQILVEYSNYLEIDNVSTGTIGSFRYIEWNDKFLSFSNNVFVLGETAVENPTFDKIFDFFEINYLKENDKYNFAEMLINDIKDFGNYIQIDFYGKNLIRLTEESSNINVLSDGLVYFNKNLYKKNQIIFSKNFDSRYKVEINTLPGRTIIQFIKEHNIEKIVVKMFGEKIKNYDSKTLLLVFNNSNLNAVFIPTYSPELNGNDWQVFSISEKFGKLVAEKFNLNVYYLTFVDVPKDVPSIVIFTSKRYFDEILKYLEGEIKWSYLKIV